MWSMTWRAISSGPHRQAAQGAGVDDRLQRRQPLQPQPGAGAAREADHHLHAPVRRHVHHAQGKIRALVIGAQAIDIGT